jgi:hypothetical protein
VLEGRPLEIYSRTPDRFLYAPGFAWLLAPLGLLPLGGALVLWCLLKAAALGLVLQGFARRLGPSRDPILAAGMCAWGVLLLARPMLIDFQYGQVNVFIMAASTWALLNHTDSRSSRWADFLSWMFVGIAGVMKVFPILLLAVPWAQTNGIGRQKLTRERFGAFFGAALLIFLPLLSLGTHGGDFFSLQAAWRDALLAKGLPLESHNQSFIALLSHYFTSQPVHVMSEGSTWVVMGEDFLSRRLFEILSLVWSFGALGLALGWILNGSLRAPLSWLALAVGLLVVPSHLIWKPYFVMGLPLAILALRLKPTPWLWLVLVFAGVNLTGFNWIGHFWSARLESGSVLLVMHLALLALVWRRGRFV